MSIYLFTTLPLDKYQGAWWMLCGEDLFTFVTNCQVVFPRGCTILHPHKQWMRVPVALYHCQHLVLSVFGIFTILIHVSWYGLRFFKILVQAEIWSLIRYLLRDYCQFFSVGIMELWFYFVFLKHPYLWNTNWNICQWNKMSGVASHYLGMGGKMDDGIWNKVDYELMCWNWVDRGSL